MNCADFEPQIADWQDGRLAPAEVTVVERHLAGCPSCSAFAASLRELDASLSRGVQLRPLGAGFDEQLRARLQPQTRADAEVRRAEIKRQLQIEYEANLVRLRRRTWSFASVLDMLGLGLLTAGAVTAAVLQAPRLLQTFPADVQPHLGSPLALGAGLGTLAVLIAGWWFSRRPAQIRSLI